MGTLDEAIREHLELKRRQGAGDDEIQKAEAEAFGPAGDDLPASPMTAPAGEGDQLDKVFSGEGEADDAPPTTVLASGSETIAPEAPEEEVAVDTEVEVEAPAGDAPVEVAESVEVEAPEVEVSSEPPAEAEPPSAPEPAAASEPAGTSVSEPVDLGDDAADASDLLEAERANLTGHPTENYDVDAAIAEEEELDLLSDSRLSEELDRALGETETDQPGGLGEPPGAEPPTGIGEETAEAEEVEEVEELPEPNFDIEPAGRPGETGSASPLEETPDFLEESDASDELWFEQGEPKDFDFGD